MVGDHPKYGRLPSMVVAPNGVSFVSSAYVPNTKSVAHFLQVDFGEGYLLVTYL